MLINSNSLENTLEPMNPGTLIFRKNSGFMLLEMIIVLFLITVILGISMLFFANFLPSNKFNATVRNISATIKQARNLARIKSERQIVIFNFDSKTYEIKGRTTQEIPADINIKVIDPVQGDIQQGEYQFILHTGGAIEGGTVVVWNAKRSASIQLDPVVGTVVIK